MVVATPADRLRAAPEQKSSVRTCESAPAAYSLKSVIAESLQTPAPYERRGKTRAEEAAELGISVSWLRKLRARERAGEVEYADRATELPWVELVDGTRPSTPHYDLRTDRLEKPAGAFRISDGRGRLKVQHAGRGKPLDDKPKKKPPKFKPKRPRSKKRPIPAA